MAQTTLILPGTQERLGNKFRDRRLAKGIKPLRLARMTRLSRETIVGLERGGPSALAVTKGEMDAIASKIGYRIEIDPIPPYAIPPQYTLGQFIDYARKAHRMIDIKFISLEESASGEENPTLVAASAP